MGGNRQGTVVMALKGTMWKHHCWHGQSVIFRILSLHTLMRQYLGTPLSPVGPPDPLHRRPSQPLGPIFAGVCPPRPSLWRKGLCSHMVKSVASSMVPGTQLALKCLLSMWKVGGWTGGTLIILRNSWNTQRNRKSWRAAKTLTKGMGWAFIWWTIKSISGKESYQ